jgi:hypothetical protein
MDVFIQRNFLTREELIKRNTLKDELHKVQDQIEDLEQLNISRFNEYIRQLAAAYASSTDIDPRSAVLLQETQTINGVETTQYYIGTRDESSQ